jgi:hypothetical protein
MPALIKAGAIIKPPPAPMQPVMRPAPIPIRIDTIKISIYTVKGRAVSFFTPQHFRQHIGDFIGKGKAAQNHRKGQQAKYE